jgi:hypothetical protein
LGSAKADIMGVFHDFHASNKFEKSFNATFIALIPKRSGAIDLKDFRPISLVSGVYRILAKVLANRLGRVVEKIISKFYNAFFEVGKSLISFSLQMNVQPAQKKQSQGKWVPAQPQHRWNMSGKEEAQCYTTNATMDPPWPKITLQVQNQLQQPSERSTHHPPQPRRLPTKHRQVHNPP